MLRRQELSRQLLVGCCVCVEHLNAPKPLLKRNCVQLGTSMTVRSTEGRETLLKLALPAPQGSGNAAARLTRRGRPAAVGQLDDFLGPRRPRSDSGR